MDLQTDKTEELIVEAIPLRDQVADIVRRMILGGELKANDPISERAISQRLRVSTTPVKEAFRILQTEGLLYVKPRRGSYVSNLFSDFMIQVVFMRGALEGVAAYFAAIYATPEEIERIEDVLHEAGEVVHASADVLEISKFNRTFHSLLRSASRNEYLISLLNSMCSIDKTFRELSLVAEDDEPARAHNEHLGILAALKERNSEEIEKRMVAHVRRIALLVVEKNKRR